MQKPLTELQQSVAIASMKLKDYLEHKNIKVADAAKALGVSSYCIGLWARGERMPRPAQMGDIFQWSGGAVEPNDFYDLVDGAVSDEVAHV